MVGEKIFRKNLFGPLQEQNDHCFSEGAAEERIGHYSGLTA